MADILIVGLGEIGYANAEYLTAISKQPSGYDISAQAINRALSNQVIRKYDNDFSKYDTFIVCVNTHNPKQISQPSSDALNAVLKKIQGEASEGSLICIESTIPLGLNLWLEQLVGARFHLVHAPHRYYKHEADVHGVNQKRVLAGLDKCCTKAGLNFYLHDLNIPMRAVSDIDTAAFIKLTENTDRFIKIAWAEYLAMVCKKNGLDFDEVRTAVNDKWNTGILQALNGIGGHCLPKDSQMFLEAAEMDTCLVRTAKQVDAQYRATRTEQESLAR